MCNSRDDKHIPWKKYYHPALHFYIDQNNFIKRNRTRYLKKISESSLGYLGILGKNKEYFLKQSSNYTNILIIIVWFVVWMFNVIKTSFVYPKSSTRNGHAAFQTSELLWQWNLPSHQQHLSHCHWHNPRKSK